MFRLMLTTLLVLMLAYRVDAAGHKDRCKI